MMWDILEMEDTPLLKMPEVTREQGVASENGI